MAITRNVLIVFAFLSFLPFANAGTSNLEQLQKALNLPSDAPVDVVKAKFGSQAAELEIMALYAPSKEDQTMFYDDLRQIQDLYRAAFGEEPAPIDVMDIPLEAPGFSKMASVTKIPVACERNLYAPVEPKYENNVVPFAPRKK